MKEIGGYLELERFSGPEYYDDMVKLNLGRTALLYLMKAAGAHTLWVSRFLCEAVLDSCTRAGYQLKYYSIGRDFLPGSDLAPQPGEYTCIVNFYGQLTQEQILSMRCKYGPVILDNTHAFFQPPVGQIPTLYSLRKFFGLCDGAYVSMGSLTPAIDPKHLEQDLSGGRMGHILGRFEADASTHYQTMLDNAHALDHELVKQMSPLTENLLHGIDYERARAAREENYRALDALLGADNPLPIHMPAGPFVYPFYHRDGMRLRRQMAKQKIYVPTYWNNVLKQMPEDSLEYDYAANILPLPCDQRYAPADMETVARVLRESAGELESACTPTAG